MTIANPQSSLASILAAVMQDPLQNTQNNRLHKSKVGTSSPPVMGGGDARLMRGSTALGGRPSAPFRKETQALINRDTVRPTTNLQGQGDLYAAALAGKDYVSADAIRDPMYFPNTGTLAGYQVTDPINNQETVQRSIDQYDTGPPQGLFSAPVHWEAGQDDRGNKLYDDRGNPSDAYWSGPPNTPTTFETQGGNAARLGPEGSPNAMQRFGGFHWGGMTPYSTAYDQFGNERSISDFPMPDRASQFSPFEGSRAQTGRYNPNTETGFTMNPYNPYDDEGASQERFSVNQSGGYTPYGDQGMGIPMSVQQLNARRAANAIAARNHYNRSWAADPSYGGGY